MKAIFERYQKVAGYHVQQVSQNSSSSPGRAERETR
jgi:hypothetical protein